MFTGIVQAKGLVIKKDIFSRGLGLQIEVPKGFNKDLKKGASIAVNGVCLTATEYTKNQISFDVIKETLRSTNLEELNENSEVNLERSLKFGDEVGGHLLSGHVCCACEGELKKTGNEIEISVAKPKEWGEYIFPKGYVALNGVSLTVGEVREENFSVYLIPETINSTNLLSVENGAKLNLEVDQSAVALVKGKGV